MVNAGHSQNIPVFIWVEKCNLRVQREEITLKQGAIEMCFPLIRWKVFETYLDDIDEAVHCNRYASLSLRVISSLCTLRLHFSTQMKTGMFWESHFHVFFFWIG
jgi:hypothetical protein